jgi:hypothetical protein
LADGKSDVVGQGEQVVRGPVKEVLIIMTAGKSDHDLTPQQQT